MTFAGSKFRVFLPAATFAMAAEFLMGLSDSVICGHVVGETGLAAVTVDLNGGGLTLVLRDDGEGFDMTDSDARLSPPRSRLVSHLLGAPPHRRNPTTTGFNRNVYRL